MLTVAGAGRAAVSGLLEYDSLPMVPGIVFCLTCLQLVLKSCGGCDGRGAGLLPALQAPWWAAAQ